MEKGHLLVVVCMVGSFHFQQVNCLFLNTCITRNTPRGSVLILLQGEKKKFLPHHSLYSMQLDVGVSHGNSTGKDEPSHE